MFNDERARRCYVPLVVVALHRIGSLERLTIAQRQINGHSVIVSHVI